MQNIGDVFKYVLLDCPPNLGILKVNAIYTADLIVVPVAYGRYGLDRTADLLESIELIREGSGMQWAILCNAFDTRNRATVASVDDELASVEANLMKTVIRGGPRRSTRRRFSGNPYMPAYPKSPAALDFMGLTKEIQEYGS